MKAGQHDHIFASYMNLVAPSSTQGISTVSDMNWQIVGTPDLNSDGKPDILWRNTSGGQLALWYMNGVSFVSGQGVSTVADQNWQIVGLR